jgi:predicted ester cyclase
MGIEENKRVVVRFHDEVINGLKFELVPELMHADMQHRRGAIGYTLSQLDPPGVASMRSLQGHERFIAGTKLLRAQFPEWHSTIEEIIAEGDRVMTRCLVRGRRRPGPFLNAEGEPRPFELAQVVIQQVREGRIASVWALSDELGFWRALGVILPGGADTFHGR